MLDFAIFNVRNPFSFQLDDYNGINNGVLLQIYKGKWLVSNQIDSSTGTTVTTYVDGAFLGDSVNN